MRGVRVVSLLPSATEIVFALGRGDDLVGVTFECDHPAEARERRVVSTSSLPDGLTPAEIDAVVSDRVAAGEDLYHLDEQALADLDADVILTQDLCRGVRSRPGPGRRRARLPRVLGERSSPSTRRRSTTSSTRSAWSATSWGWPGTRRASSARCAGGSNHSRARSATRRPRDVVVLEWTDPPFSAGHWVPDLVVAGGRHAVASRTGGTTRCAWSGAALTRAAPRSSWSPRAATTCRFRRAGPAAGRHGPAPGRCGGLGGRRRQPLRPTRAAPGGGRRDHGPDPAPGPAREPRDRTRPAGWTPDGRGASSAQASVTGSTSRQRVRSAVAARMRRDLVGRSCRGRCRARRSWRSWRASTARRRPPRR